LPWLLVLVCVATISVLVALLIISKQRSSLAETVAAPQTSEPSPTATPSEIALNPNVNQPAPVGSPAEKKQATPAPTPAAAVVNDPQPEFSATPTPTPVVTPTPTPTPTPEPAVDTNRVYSNREVSEGVRISSKPKPVYTDAARQNQVVGVVVLKVILKFDGSVGSISVVSGLPNGLTEQAIAAARKIKFTPAQKDGVPVSVSVQVEYVFNLY
jgi:TonB family protein